MCPAATEKQSPGRIKSEQKGPPANLREGISLISSLRSIDTETDTQSLGLRRGGGRILFSRRRLAPGLKGRSRSQLLCF